MKSQNIESENLTSKALDSFTAKFGKVEKPTVILSPASLILLGDHTHYNEGVLISCAINAHTAIVFSQREDEQRNFYFSEKSLSKEFCDSSSNKSLLPSKIVNQVSNLIYEKYNLSNGFNCTFLANIPQSVGLGGISSLSIGLVEAFNREFKLKMKPEEINALAREAEVKMIGKISSEANHFTVSNAKTDNLMFIDLRTKKYRNYTFDGKKYKIVICDTGIRFNSAQLCNDRIEECEIGVKGLRLYIWGIKNLRDVNDAFLFKHRHMIPKIVYDRVNFNVEERFRVERAIAAIKNDDKQTLADEIYNSHTGLSSDYKISIPELDFLVEEAKSIDGIVASKMISCSPIRSTFNIVEAEKAESFGKEISNIYKKAYKNKLNIHIFGFSSGVSTS